MAAFVLGGQVFTRILQGKIHWRNFLDQLKLVGPRSLGVALLTAGFVGMVFTIQVRLPLSTNCWGQLGIAGCACQVLEVFASNVEGAVRHVVIHPSIHLTTCLKMSWRVIVTRQAVHACQGILVQVSRHKQHMQSYSGCTRLRLAGIHAELRLQLAGLCLQLAELSLLNCAC